MRFRPHYLCLFGLLIVIGCATDKQVDDRKPAPKVRYTMVPSIKDPNHASGR